MVQKSFFYLTTLSSLFDPETLGVLIAHSSRAGSQLPGPSPLSLLSCPATDPHPCPPALALPTHTGHTSPPTLCAPSAMSHPARPTTQPSPSQTHCSKSRPLTQQTERRTSPSLPQLPVFPPPASTPVDIYLKKVTFEAKTRFGGWMLGRGGLFCPCCPDTPASSTISAWLPPQPQTNVASLLTCYLKPVPRLAHGGFRLTSWSHQRAGGVPVPCAVPGAPTPAPASSVSDQPVY